MSSTEPWYKTLGGEPFKLIASLEPSPGDCDFQAVAIFPWGTDSLSRLWRGDFENHQEEWSSLIDKWSGAVAIGAGRRLRIFISRPRQPFVSLFAVELPEDALVQTITWCLITRHSDSRTEFIPLVAFSGGAIVYLLNINTRTFHGALRGHGGRITSLVVHPLDPSTLCSTSYDQTARIYNLEREVPTHPVNPKWPGSKKQSMAGPPFGLRGQDGEGFGFGSWVAVLAGGPSGGHQAAVLGAASISPVIPNHRDMRDHCVKLWHIPDLAAETVSREDKPMFSSSRVHSAPVRSITWLGQDLLVSHSDPITYRANVPDRDRHSELWCAAGTLVIWRWLGLDRYFPPDRSLWTDSRRGCPSDYLESASFKVFAEYNMPSGNKPVEMHVHLSRTMPVCFLIPDKGGIKVGTTLHFRPRKPLPFPSEEVVHGIENISLSEPNEKTRDEDIVQWVIKTNDETHQVKSCALNGTGHLLIGVGEKGGAWLWRRDE